MTDFDSDFIYVICNLCNESIYNPTADNSIEEDGLIYHKECWEKVVEKQGGKYEIFS